MDFLIAQAIRRGLARIAVLAEASPHGDTELAELTAAMKRQGLQPVAVERYKPGDGSMIKQLEHARAAGAQVLITSGGATELAVIAKDRLRMNWQVAQFGSWLLSARGFIDAAGSAGEGALMPQTFIQEVGSVQGNGFLIAYRNAFQVELIGSPMSAAQGYDAVHLLASAIRQGRSTAGVAIKDELEALRQPLFGVIAIYERPFSNANHDAITSKMLMLGQVRGGRVVHPNRN